MFDAFFFDLDGTIIDTETLWVEAVECFLRDTGIEPRHEDVLEDVYGIAWQDVREKLFRRYPGVTWNLDGIKQHFLRLRGSRPLPIESSIRLLRDLAETHPVAVVSGSTEDDVEQGIDLAGVRDCLVFALNSECYTQGKPNPECYRMAAGRLSVEPARCLVFEDSTVGVAAAKDAGMHCVALARPGRPAQDFARADWVLDDLGRFSIESYARERGPA